MEINTPADLLFSTTLPSATAMDSIAGATLGRGIDAFMAKDYDTAVKEFRRSIALSPFSDNSLKAFEYMAKALAATGKTREAITAYKQAINVFPSADGLNLALGNLLYAEKRYEEALGQYKAAVSKNTLVSQNFYSLGQGYLALEQYDEAEQQFKKVIQMSPQESGGYYALGQTYRMAGRYGEAEERLGKALSIETDAETTHYELGITYALQRQIDKANEELAILEAHDSAFFEDLQKTINENSAPRLIAAYTSGLNLASTPGTLVSSLDSALATPGVSKNFTMNFVFDKDMDIGSVQNIANWNISRSVSSTTGGLYNWGRSLPVTEVSLSPMPTNVIYDPDSLTATITFKITQNSTGDGTIDPSHLVFKFQGTDIYGNPMNTSADQYNRFSKIV